MIICVDIGGTKILIAKMDSGKIIGDSIKIKTPHDAAEAIERTVTAIKELPGYEKAHCISIAAPGKIDRESRMLISCGNLPWTNIPIAQIISQELSLPTYIENDANLAGLAEARMQHFSKGTTLYLTISTGIGSGVVVDNNLAPGLEQSEAGQMMIHYGGEFQMWEKFASGKILFELYEKKASDITDSAVWYRVSESLIHGIFPCIAAFQPDRIIIGGSIGTYFDRYSQLLITLLNEQNDSAVVEIPPIYGAKNAESAVLYGCYEYANDQRAQHSANS